MLQGRDLLIGGTAATGSPFASEDTTQLVVGVDDFIATAGSENPLAVTARPRPSGARTSAEIVR